VIDQIEELFSLTTSTKLDGSTDVRLVLVRQLDRERTNTHRLVVTADVVRLVLVRQLDREQTNTHRLVVTALDGGRPRRSGTLNILVEVLDANDNRSAAD